MHTPPLFDEANARWPERPHRCGGCASVVIVDVAAAVTSLFEGRPCVAEIELVVNLRRFRARDLIVDTKPDRIGLPR